MNNIFIKKMPKEIKNNILSYIYFPDHIINDIIRINDDIINYKTNVIYVLYNKYDIDYIYYSVLKYFLYDVENIKKYNINYDPIHYHYTTDIKNYEIYRIFKQLRYIDVLRIYKFIMFNGKSSEYYILF
uniref:Ankyrin repeat protein n=1 Tax=Florenciella sp. virus SA2 TaxID=3240092 RepID=A0AB39JBB6_9VIRU